MKTTTNRRAQVAQAVATYHVKATGRGARRIAAYIDRDAADALETLMQHTGATIGAIVSEAIKAQARRIKRTQQHDSDAQTGGAIRLPTPPPR